MGTPESGMTPQPLQVTLALTDAHQQHLAQAQAIIAEANGLVVDSLPMAEHANGVLRDIKARRSRIEEMHNDIVNPVKLALANAKKWFMPSLDAHDQAEQIVKGKLAAFTKQEQARAAAEQKARDEAARRAREEAEQKAAAERARAAAAAAEARRKAEEAAERERKAREEGNARAAAAAAAERAKQEENERQRIAEGERKAAEAQLTAAAAAKNAAPVQEAAKVDGFSLRDSWGAELAQGTEEDEAKLAIARAIAAGRHELLALIKIDTTTANKMAKALKKNFNVPGMCAINNPVPVSRA